MPKKGEILHIERTGEKFTICDGYEATIISYRKSTDLDVILNEGTIITNISYSNLRKGILKNPNHPSVYGVGYIGQGEYGTLINGKLSKAYDVWHSFLRRSYWKGYHASEKSYKDTTVCEAWKCFQTFAKWFYKNYNSETMKGWDLDKDILVKGNKIYSPKTCCFVPLEINKFFCKTKEGKLGLKVGVKINGSGFQCRVHINGERLTSKTFKTQEEAFFFYKTEKEEYAKVLAEKWKNLIPKEIYNKLIEYKVEN